MKKNILVIIGARGIGDLIYHLPLLRSLYQSYNQKVIIFLAVEKETGICELSAADNVLSKL